MRSFSRGDENYVNGMIKTLEVGNTEVAADFIQEITGADLFQIQPMQAYSKDYNECIEQAQADQKRNARPELKCYPESFDRYDTIYLGYPNYWGTMPMAVFTFWSTLILTGKLSAHFVHMRARNGRSVRDIKKLCPNAEVKAGMSIPGGSVKRARKIIEKWIEAGRK